MALNKNGLEEKEAFLKEWPIVRLEKMTLEEYTNREKSTAFIFWLESTTTNYGSIWGGSAYKFGVFSRENTKNKVTGTMRLTDGVYSWLGKHGSTAEEAFQKVKGMLLKIAKAAVANDLEAMDDVDLGNAVKWKVAALYSSDNVIPLYSDKILNKVGVELGLSKKECKTVSKIQRLLIEKKGEKNALELAEQYWTKYNAENTTMEEQYKSYMNRMNMAQKTISSYLKANKTTSAFLIKEDQIKKSIYELETVAEVEEVMGFLSTNEEFSEKNDKDHRLYSAAINKYISFFKTLENSDMSKVKDQLLIPKNQILYGPPGTGKTFHTIDLSVKIADQNFWEENQNDRVKLKARYKELTADGKISFTTFHQSLSYEDFIEGIKPVTDDDKNVTYEIEDGIFKSVCEQAKSLKVDESAFDWSGRSFFKISLGGKQNQEIHTKCIEDGIVALGWGGQQDLSDYIGISSWNKFKNRFSEEFPELVEESRFNTQAAFKLLSMKKGDVVVASIGNNIIDAIGIVEGEYEFDSDNVFEYYHTRKVKWIANELNTNPSRFFRKKISQQAIYEFYTADVKHEAFKELTNTESVEEANHVLIIDEINRGNVSQIFGELITLIEDSKRIGAEEELKVILPYSKTQFGVPSNVHIIGTMNTADRSVEALDTALRRRFSFVEMLPKPEVIAKGKSEGEVGGIDLVQLLKTINERIEVLVDRDHTIGHAFFMGVNSPESLQTVIADKIIPLLQEYFYGDYQKMEMVLGELFFKKKEANDVVFATGGELPFEGQVYTIKDVKTMEKDLFLKAIEGIKYREVKA